MNNTLQKETHERLGFDKLDSTEIVVNLNQLLANYQVFFHKLQNFHWNVIGSDFFDVHDITEEMYRKGLEDIDNIAERIRVFGKRPISTMELCLKESNIKESKNDKSGEVMMLEIVSDITILLSFLIEVAEAANKNGDLGTSHMMSEMIKNLETYHWQLTAWSNQKYSY